MSIDAFFLAPSPLRVMEMKNLIYDAKKFNLRCIQNKASWKIGFVCSKGMFTNFSKFTRGKGNYTFGMFKLSYGDLIIFLSHLQSA